MCSISDRKSLATAARRSFFVVRGEEGRVELLALDLEPEDVACKQTCAKSEKGSAKLLVAGDVGKVEEHEIDHGKLNAGWR